MAHGQTWNINLAPPTAATTRTETTKETTRYLSLGSCRTTWRCRPAPPAPRTPGWCRGCAGQRWTQSWSPVHISTTLLQHIIWDSFWVWKYRQYRLGTSIQLETWKKFRDIYSALLRFFSNIQGQKLSSWSFQLNNASMQVQEKSANRQCSLWSFQCVWKEESNLFLCFCALFFIFHMFVNDIWLETVDIYKNYHFNQS